MTNHAVQLGDQLTFGRDGNGSCKYTGDHEISPAWLLTRGNGQSTSVTSGENVYPGYRGIDDLKLKKRWDGKYFLTINTRNTSLAGTYRCQHSDARYDIVHNVAVLRWVGVE